MAKFSKVRLLKANEHSYPTSAGNVWLVECTDCGTQRQAPTRDVNAKRVGCPNPACPSRKQYKRKGRPVVSATKFTTVSIIDGFRYSRTLADWAEHLANGWAILPKTKTVLKRDTPGRPQAKRRSDGKALGPIDPDIPVDVPYYPAKAPTESSMRVRSQRQHTLYRLGKVAQIDHTYIVYGPRIAAIADLTAGETGRDGVPVTPDAVVDAQRDTLLSEMAVFLERHLRNVMDRYRDHIVIDPSLVTMRADLSFLDDPDFSEFVNAPIAAAAGMTFKEMAADNVGEALRFFLLQTAGTDWRATLGQSH